MAEAAFLEPEPLAFEDLPVADLGTISIRVFVLPPKPKKGTEKQVSLPLNVEEGAARNVVGIAWRASPAT